MKLRNLPFLWNFWPPFLGLGIRIKNVSRDSRRIVIELKKRPWNANYFGTQFGGGIFSMTDGVHILMLVRNLGKGYRLWDKAAKIDYLKKGLTNLTAEFILTEHDLQFIREETAKKSKIDWIKTVNILDKNADVVASVERTISIKRK